MTVVTTDGSRLVRVAALAELPPGEPVVITLEGVEIMLVRAADDRVYAIDNTCTHAEASLDMGLFHPDTFEIECPLHIGRFDVRDGSATAEPCVVAVRSHRVVIDGDGVFAER